MPALLARQMLDGLFLICGENKGAYFHELLHGPDLGFI